MNRFGQIFEGERREELLSSDGESKLVDAFLEAGVICLRGEPVMPDKFLRIAAILGEPQSQLLRAHRLESIPQVSIISSQHRDVLGNGGRSILGRYWHTDDSYFAVPSSITLLHANAVPGFGKGDTLFTDMRAAWESLDIVNSNHIRNLKAVHKYKSRRNVSAVPKRSKEEEAETPEVVHPLVRTHPDTGRQALYLNPNRIDHIVGLSLSDGDKLLDNLIKISTRSDFVYRHHWEVGDIVIWDNRCTMHRVNYDFGEMPREMMRILLKGTVPY